MTLAQLLLTATYLVLAESAAQINQTALERPVSVADAIEMTRLADPAYVSGSSSCGRVASLSRDNARFIVVLRRGRVENNTNEFRMLLWATDRIVDARRPQTLLVMSSSSNRPAIESVSWAGDNRTILFLGEQLHSLHQLYSFNVPKHALRRLTNSPTNVSSYSASLDGSIILYTAERRPTNPLDGRDVKRAGLIVADQSLSDILSSFTTVGGPGGGSTQLFILLRGQQPRLLSNTTMVINPSIGGPSLSPDGKYAAMLTRTRFQSAWKAYRDPESKSMEDEDWALQYQLVNIQTGSIRPLVDAPLRTWTFPRSPQWSPDGASVIVTDTYLPPGNVDSAARETGTSSTFAVEVKVPTGDMNVVTSDNLELVRWNARTGDVVFQREDPAHQGRWSCPTVVFHKNGNAWEQASHGSGTNGQPAIALEEGMNLAPRLIATDSSEKRLAVLLDLNPQFKDLRFAHEAILQWKTADGHDVIGGLYYPVHYVRGVRYPLVIQTHAFTPERFWIDGPWSTAFAAQALAGRDIVVLQTYSFPETTYDAAWNDYVRDFGTPREVNREVAMYQGSIDALDAQGLIDRNRVGLIGFSRTCLHVKYALTHSNFEIAAASVTDGFDAGYFQYISFPLARPAIEALIGMPPFGDGLQQWLRDSPGFSIDRVRTPVRIVALNPGSAVGEWEWLAGLRRLGKPAEMVVIADGAHELQKPWDRMISQDGNVDWFDFWLNGHEGLDPSKAEQYRRWEQLCDMQVTQNPNQPAFCVRTKPH